MNKIQFVKGFFDYETLTVKLGSELSKKNPLIIAKAVKVPDFKYKVKEPADAGGGCYYGYNEVNEYTETNAYIIMKDNEILGWMNPHAACHKIKSDLYPLDWKHTRIQIKNFAATLQPPPAAVKANEV